MLLQVAILWLVTKLILKYWRFRCRRSKLCGR